VAHETDSSPYVGPRPFYAEDRAMFFGRDREIAELLSLVVAHRVVLLYAVSGAGKTSLLTAGLSSALTDHGFDVFPPLRVQVPIQPPDGARNVFAYATLWALTHRFDAADANGVNEIDLDLTLEGYLGRLQREGGAYGFSRPRVLIFDQFEEIFTSYQQRWPDREAFLHEVAVALTADPELRVVFSLREEYIAQLDRYAGLLPGGLRARFHLERLRRDPALLAVRGPLECRGIHFAPGVAETLIHDLQETRIDTSVAGPGATAIVQGEFVEPVHLQVVCSTLWRQLDRTLDKVTHDDIAALGGVDDSLIAYYDSAIAAALTRANVAEHKLRAALERAFITSAGTRATVFASAEETADLPTAALDELARRHVIRAEWRSGGRWLELAHDRLIEPVRRSNATVLDRRTRRMRRRLAGAAAIVIATLATGLLFTGTLLSALVEVPNVVGKDASTARKQLRQAGLSLAPIRAQVNNTKRAGTVFEQSPRAGSQVEEGVSVSLSVAAKGVVVPNVVGYSLRRAGILLHDVGLEVGQVSPRKASRRAVVEAQLPTAGKCFPVGGSIELSVRDPDRPVPLPRKRDPLPSSDPPRPPDPVSPARPVPGPSVVPPPDAPTRAQDCEG
jgi:PASTA domain